MEMRLLSVHGKRLSLLRARLCFLQKRARKQFELFRSFRLRWHIFRTVVALLLGT